MNNLPITPEATKNSSAPRAITLKETEEIVECLATMILFDLENDELQPYEAFVRAELQKAAICLFDTAQPYRKKIAVIVWSTDEGQFEVFAWDDEEHCHPVEFVQDYPDRKD